MFTNVQRHTIRKRLQHLLLTAVLCLFAASCTTDEVIKHPSPEIEENQETVMRLTIHTPPATIPETKSQTAGESEISEIRVLVFQNGSYVYTEDGDISSSENHSTTFTTTLLSSASPVTLFLIANANASIDNAGIMAGDSPSEVKAKLQYTFTSSGISGQFPMYGEHTLSSVSTSGNVVSGIKMLRAIARADVIIGDEVSNFEMVSVQLFRTNSRIQVIPNAVSNGAVTAPSVPDGSDVVIHTPALTVTGNQSVSQLYFPESAAPADNELVSGATCIVVGGKYNNSPTVTYYRVDFNLGIEGHPFGQILRNHKYIFNILSVTIQGKTTPEEAANGQSMGIVAEVQTWDENSTDMWYEGEQYFSVSTRTVYLRPWAGTFEQSNTLKINTDIPSYTFQWSDASGAAVVGSQPSSTTISNDNYRVTLSGSTITVEALSNNTADDNRLDYFVIHAGRWDVVITICQYGLSKHSNDLVRVLSFTEIGDLGSGYANETTGAAAVAMRQMLNVQFSPTGTFKFGGYYFAEMAAVVAGTTTVTPTVMSNFDVILFPYNQQPNATLAANVVNWLKAKPNRVLIVAADAVATNINLLAALGDNLGWSYSPSGTIEYFNYSVDDNTKLFTQTGLFGSITPTSQYRSYDGVWGMSTTPNSEVTPLLKRSDGNMMLGVNMDKRVVYIGEVQMFYNYTGGLSSAGAVSTDQDRLMGNLWAWITETVLSGK